MAREHFWQDRVQIKRMKSKSVRGAQEHEAEVNIGAPISCLLANISGKEAPDTARTYLPENALLHYAALDTDGNPVVMKQGDTIEVTYALNWDGTPRGRFKVVGDVRPNRRGSELVSYTAEVRKETEH